MCGGGGGGGYCVIKDPVGSLRVGGMGMGGGICHSGTCRVSVCVCVCVCVCV